MNSIYKVTAISGEKPTMTVLVGTREAASVLNDFLVKGAKENQVEVQVIIEAVPCFTETDLPAVFAAVNSLKPQAK